MSNEEYTAKDKQAAREFLESLSNAELRGMMDSPVLSSVLMEHLEESDLLTRRVSELLEGEFRELPDEEQTVELERIARLAVSLAGKYAQTREEEGDFTNTLAGRLTMRPTSPAAERLLATLKRYINVPEQLLHEWLDLARSNAQLFLRGLDMPEFDHAAEFDHDRQMEMPAIFKQGALTIQLDKRDEIDRFVVEVTCSDESLCGRELTVFLVGQTGEDISITVRLDGRRGEQCFGKEASDATIAELVTRLGSVIVPVIQTGEDDPKGS